MKKKNILIILPWLPYPMKSGGHQAIYNGIKAIYNNVNVFITYTIDDVNYNKDVINKFLQIFDNNITIAPFIIDTKPSTNNLFQNIYVCLWRIKQLLFFKKVKQKSSINTKAWIEIFFPKNDLYIQHINNLINKFNIDLVQCEMLTNGSIVLNLPTYIKKIFVHHEIGFVCNKQIIQDSLEFNHTDNTFFKLAKILELEVLNYYDGIITLSKSDENILKESGIKTAIFPSLAIVDNSHNYIPSLKDQYKLSFIGPQFHSPNLKGVNWFLENCWKDLKKKNSNYKLNIIGSWDKCMQDEISSNYSDVYFLGYVDNLAEALRDTTLIVPITVGSGIRMKILEAAAIGIPIVTTTIGVTGIPFKNNLHCMISDTPADFIKSILNLQNETTRSKLIYNANQVVTNFFSLETLKNNRLSIYKQILKEKE